ncbi:MAG: Crp/Fnr family transcriptional regulator [Rhizobiaceae bacterium]|nr:Crp/Fnr family transcriptional regulator [Rhizobiaceae bacterium]MBL4695908.1 Crp/Fnr family transcriptional regulator [Rhizobiaceae bacterium]
METLCDIPLFSALDETLGEQYGKSCLWKEYGENELVIDEDDDTKDLRCVISGRVRIINRIAIGKEVILGEMKDGDFFGEIAAIDDETRSATVTTLTRTKICVVPQRIFHEILTNSKEVSFSVLKVLTNRVRHLNFRLAEQSFLQAKHRLYAEIVRLSKPRMGHEGQRSISPPPIQRVLAERIGTRREVVSRELNKLEKQGVIQKNKGALVLVDVAELQRRISEAWEE